MRWPYATTSSTATIYRNGQVVTSTALFSREPWGFNAIGTYHDQYYMVGELSEVLAYDHAVTEDERASIETYLQSKYTLF